MFRKPSEILWQGISTRGNRDFFRNTASSATLKCRLVRVWPSVMDAKGKDILDPEYRIECVQHIDSVGAEQWGYEIVRLPIELLNHLFPIMPDEATAAKEKKEEPKP